MCAGLCVGKNKNPITIYQLVSYGILIVTPTGFEPISSEPESDILSIELWGLSGAQM